MIFASGLKSPEGPVLLPDCSWIVVEMDLSQGSITWISPDGKEKRVIAKTGGPNGQAVDRDGVIWVAETLAPSLVRVTLNGQKEEFLTGCDGEPFLFPNDVAFGPDGALYMTDSGILNSDFAPGGNVRPDYRSLTVDGRLYRMDVKTKEVRKLDSGLQFPNGIAFGPDQALYVSETFTGQIYRYPWQDGKVSGPRQVYGNVEPVGDPNLITGPDGMKFGLDRCLYVATLGHGDVSVLDPQGKLIQRIKTNGRLATNLAFGPSGTRSIYVTEVEFGSFEVFYVKTDGLPLFYG
jgi:gluconolactonase